MHVVKFEKSQNPSKRNKKAQENETINIPDFGHL